jgi:hypothetical protein
MIGQGNTGQHSVETLVDRCGIPSGGVRDLLVDYLRDLKPSMDYGTLEGWAYRLVRLFWWEVLQINPGQVRMGCSSAGSPRAGCGSDARP